MKIFDKILQIFLLFAFFAPTQIFAQQTNSIISTQEKIEETVKLAPCKNNDRFVAVKKLFVQMGAKDDEVSVVKFDKLSNAIVRKKGKFDETIII
ncbi:MAG: hypothetical protein LC768_09480 [Acidobacteria bacterium]|nr:hypothetical protein [Acidobacteriota bacterium]MCA1638548.1 hypothetical protein [Acidobacteriota bacterium]